MIQTKFFDGDKLDKIEGQLNSFLRGLKGATNIKIKYRKKLVAKAWYNEDHDVRSWFSYSVMVVYEE